MAVVPLLAVYIFLTYFQTGQTITYNSTTACLKGTERSGYSATCDRNTTNEVGIIAINRVFYGAQPDDQRCQATDNASVCCIYTPDQDCFFATKPGEVPPTVVAGCSGYKSCNIAARGKYTGSTCEPPSNFLYSSFSTYGFFEYQCINVALLTDVCHTGIINNKEELYIDTNVLHVNTEHRDKSCSCKVTTSCGAAIIFEAVDIQLHKVTGTKICKEKLELMDDKNNESNRTVTCQETKLNGFAEFFTSESNSVTVTMTVNGNNTGKLWMKMKSSWTNATVQVQCGATANIETITDHLCDEDLTTSTSTTTTTSTTTPPPTTTTSPTTTTTETTTTAPTTTASESDNQILGLPTGAIAGIIVAAVLIFLVIIFILVLVFRRNKRAPEHMYEIPTRTDPGYETLHYHNPESKVPPQVNGFDNPGYDREKFPPEGAAGFTDPTDPAQYDNVCDEDVMVMPKGAVM